MRPLFPAAFETRFAARATDVRNVSRVERSDLDLTLSRG